MNYSQQNQSVQFHRKNGLDRPWGYAQIGAWITYCISILQYCIFITPLLSPCIVSPILSIFFFLSNIYVFIYGSYTILINPIDIHLQQHRCQQESSMCHQHNHDHHDNNNGDSMTRTNGTKGRQHNIMKPVIIRNPLHQPAFPIRENNINNKKKTTFSDRLYYRVNAKQLQLYNHHIHTDTNQQSQSQSQQSLPNEPMKQCWICDTTVAEHSMHCKFCNKCVYGFDHHCIWLNTCIGRANYASFFRTLQSLFGMEIIHLISHLVLIISFFHDNDENDDETLRGRIRTVYPNIGIYTPFALWIFFFLFNCMAIILLGQLYIFHTLLQQRNLTTYEHIVQDYRNQRSLARRMNELEAERSELIIRAQSQNDTVKVIQLKCGRFCRKMNLSYFDILFLPPEHIEPDPEAGFANIFGTSNNNDNNDDIDNDGHDNDRGVNQNENYDIGNADVVEITDYDDDDNNNNNYGQDNDNDDNDNVNDGVDKIIDHENMVGVEVDVNDDNNTNMNDTNADQTKDSSSNVQQQQQQREIVIHGSKKRAVQTPKTKSESNYVELTMSGQNDYANNNNNNNEVVVDDDNNIVEYNDHSSNFDISHIKDADNMDHDDDDDEEEEVDGIFLDNDDLSYRSGCSGRSYRSGRSGRSGRSSKSGKSGKLTGTGSGSGERDLTAF